MLDVLLDAFIDTIKISWLLLIIHILIELFEYKAKPKLKLNRVLMGNCAPLIGAGVGLIPQCGFSVVAANLYSKRHIPLGALLAVFIATSDEAVPILLSNPSAIMKLLPLLGIKFVFALIVGYIVLLTYDRKKPVVLSVSNFLNEEQRKNIELKTDEHIHGEHTHEKHSTNQVAQHNIENNIHGTASKDLLISNDSPTINNNTTIDDEFEAKGCHGHKIGEGGKNDLWVRFLFHPLLHTFTILLYIFIVNFLFGIIIYFLGEEKLTNFMQGTRYAQPFLAALIGMIPNCASSVAIAQLYSLGGLTLGSAVAGLSVNAGLGMAVLFKQNKSMKENLSVFFGLYLVSSLVGLMITFITNMIF